MPEMMGMRGGDIDKVHFRILHQLPVGAIGLRNPMLRSEGLRLFQTSGCNGMAFTILRLSRQCPGHLYGNVAGSYYSQFHVCGSFLQIYTIPDVNRISKTLPLRQTLHYPANVSEIKKKHYIHGMKL